MRKNVLILIACLLVLNTILYFNNNILKVIFMVILVFVSGFLICKEIKVLYKYFTHYMFNLRTDFFDKYIERPRLFVYLSIGTINLFILNYFIHIFLHTPDPAFTILPASIYFMYKYLLISVIFIVYVISVFILNFTWSSRFLESIVRPIQISILKSEKKDFELTGFNYNQFKVLYNNLHNLNFIEIIDDSFDFKVEELFAQILFKGKVPEVPKFKLNFDNVQTKYFWDKLKAKDESFTLDFFLKIFRNKNENSTRESVEASFSKSSKIPKRVKDIDECFKFEKEG